MKRRALDSSRAHDFEVPRSRSRRGSRDLAAAALLFFFFFFFLEKEGRGRGSAAALDEMESEREEYRAIGSDGSARRLLSEITAPAHSSTDQRKREKPADSCRRHSNTARGSPRLVDTKERADAAAQLRAPLFEDSVVFPEGRGQDGREEALQAEIVDRHGPVQGRMRPRSRTMQTGEEEATRGQWPMPRPTRGVGRDDRG